MYWWLDLLTTYTHDSELQAITAPPLISTFYKSQQHPLSLFQPAVSSQTVPCHRLLTVEILQLHALKSSLSGGSLPTASFPHRLPYRTDLVAPLVFLITPFHGPSRKHRFQQYLYCCMCMRCCGKVFIEPLPRNKCSWAVRQQWLFLWLHSSWFEEIRHNTNTGSMQKMTITQRRSRGRWSILRKKSNRSKL
jgi:hypothetical protein